MNDREERIRALPLEDQDAFIRRTPVGHALVVAGPGTGKTFTLEERARFVVEQAGFDDNSVAVLTLTRAMVGSLAERMPYGRCQTFHSFALAKLNRLGAAWGRKVADPWEQDNIVALDLELATEDAFNVAITPTQVERFLGRMASAFRESQTEPPDPTPVEQQLLRVFTAHRSLFHYCLMDELSFDLVQLIEQGIDIPNVPRLVLADEYQDFTPGELRLLQLLAERFGSVIEVAGDDRQSIYGFRAADPLALHKFPAAYKVATIDYLHRSRRCPAVVCALAEAVAQGLPALEGIDRPALEPWPGREDQGAVNIVVAPGAVTEARWIVEECVRLVAGGRRPSDIVVIASSFYDIVWRLLRSELERIDEAPFEFYNPRGTDPIAEDVGVRLLAAGVRLLVDADDQMAWRTLVWATPQLGSQRVLALLKEGGSSYIDNLNALAERDAIIRRPRDAGQAAIAAFKDMVEVPAIDLVALLTDGLGIRDASTDNLEGLISDGPEVRPPTEWLQAVFDVSQAVTITPEQRPHDIPIRTVFGAKGLECPVVFLAAAIPQSFSRGNAADELRKLYVGLTRASETLNISAPGWLGGSQFEYAARSKVGGLDPSLALAAERLGIPIRGV